VSAPTPDDTAARPYAPEIDAAPEVAPASAPGTVPAPVEATTSAATVVPTAAPTQNGRRAAASGISALLGVGAWAVLQNN